MATSRVQLALNVRDISTATAFYERLFGVAPHKQRPGYANFELMDPPLKLVLIANDGADGALNHLGVELATSEDVRRVAEQLEQRSLSVRTTESEVCCHATQDKVYVDAPDVPFGMWEFYTVTDDAPDPAAAPSETCCVAPTEPDSARSCCS